MRKRKQSKIICNNCNKEFLKDDSEIKRNNKLGRKLFCSLRCSAMFHNVLEPYHGKFNENLEINLRDKYSDFRPYIRRVIKRNKEKNISTGVNLEDLLNLWNKQKGICIYTGVNLIHKETSKEKIPFFKIASLDRIDSSVGYTNENVQFVSAMANLAKNKLSHNEMVEFCKIISEFWNKKEQQIEDNNFVIDGSKFQIYLSRAKSRPKEYLKKFKTKFEGCDEENALTIDYLVEQWELQKGRCPYSGVKLIHADVYRNKKHNLTEIASLDRINSEYGYIKGNVQFVSAVCNFAKRNMSHEEMLEFCKIIAEFWKNKN